MHPDSDAPSAQPLAFLSQSYLVKRSESDYAETSMIILCTPEAFFNYYTTLSAHIKFSAEAIMYTEPQRLIEYIL